MRFGVCVAVTLIVLMLLTGGAFTRADTRETTKALRAVVVAYYQAIEENNIEKAMRYYHSHAPHALRVGQDLAVAMANYLQSTATLTFSSDTIGDGAVVAQATHRILILSGIKITKRMINTRYWFRQERGQWKIWLTTEQSLK